MCNVRVLFSHFLRLTNARVDNPPPPPKKRKTWVKKHQGTCRMINRGNFFSDTVLFDRKSRSMYVSGKLPTYLSPNLRLNNYWMRFFMISRIIKGEVSVISRSRRLRGYTLPVLTYNFADFSVFSAYLYSTNISVSRSIN